MYLVLLRLAYRPAGPINAARGQLDLLCFEVCVCGLCLHCSIRYSSCITIAHEMHSMLLMLCVNEDMLYVMCM